MKRVAPLHGGQKPGVRPFLGFLEPFKRCRSAAPAGGGKLTGKEIFKLLLARRPRTAAITDTGREPFTRLFNISFPELLSFGECLASKIWRLFSNKDYKVCYCWDPWGTVIELNSHSYLQTWSNLEEPHKL